MIFNYMLITKTSKAGAKNPLDRAKQGAMIMTNGTRPLNAVPSDCQVVPRSSSHFGDFNATSHHLATRSTHLGSFPVTSVFLSGVDRTCKNLPSREVAPIGRQALYKTEVAPVISTLEQPDTLGCSVFRCGASLMRLPRSPGKESVTASPMAKPLARIGPPLLKALLPKFHWLIIARLSKVNLKVTSIKWHHTANCALVELEPRGQGTPVHDRYLPSRKGR